MYNEFYVKRFELRNQYQMKQSYNTLWDIRLWLEDNATKEGDIYSVPGDGTSATEIRYSHRMDCSFRKKSTTTTLHITRSRDLPEELSSLLEGFEHYDGLYNYALGIESDHRSSNTWVL